MLTRSRTILCAVFLLACAVSAGAQAWSGQLDSSRAIDWSGVGISGGLPDSAWTQCGSTIAAYSGTAATINSAIAACGANQYVHLGTGTFTLSTAIDALGHSNFVVRGDGPKNTILAWTAGSNCGTGSGNDHVCLRASSNVYDNSASVLPPCGGGGSSNCATWSAGYAKGTTSITLTNVGSNTPTVGMLIILDQANDTNCSSGLVQGDNDSSGTCSGNDGGFGRTISGVHYSQVQPVTVTSASCSGTPTTCTVGITPGVYANNIRSGQNPGAWWNTTYLSNAGVENMTLDYTASGGYGLSFYDCIGCWVSNVRSLRSGRNHIYVNQSAHGVIRDSYFFGVQSGGGETSYGIEGNEAADFLIENNIFDQISSPVIFDNVAGFVVGYNYSLNNVFSNPNFLQTSLPSHDPGNQNNLFEGNNFNALDSDNQHGASPLTTVFRNHIPGNQPAPSNKTEQTEPLGVDSINRAWNVIGNALGTYACTGGTTPGAFCNGNGDCGGGGSCSSYQTVYEVSPNANGGSNTGCNTAIYAIGWGAVSSGCTNPGPPTAASGNDLTVSTSMMRWGNWDSVNNAARFNNTEASPAAITYVNANSVPASHTLPSSYYLSAKPSFFTTSFGSRPFPPIGPDVTGGNSLGTQGFANTIPAETCAANTSYDSSYGSTATITSITESGTTATATTSSAYGSNYHVSSTVLIAGASVSGYNGLQMIQSTPTSTTFTFNTNSGLGTSSGGTAKLPVLAYDASSCYSPPTLGQILLSGKASLSGNAVVGGLGTAPLPSEYPLLPELWVNNHEGDSAFTYELSLPNTWVTGPAPSCTFHLPYWSGSATLTGLQSAIVDIEACRTATGVGIALDIPPALYTGSFGPYLPQTSSVQASNFLILRSTQDSHLPNGTTVCSHGIQDNLSESTDIGLINPDCVGDNVTYVLGGWPTGLNYYNRGTVSTDATGLNVSLSSGGNFNTGWTSANTFYIGGIPYTISSVSSTSALTLASAAPPDLSGVVYSVAKVSNPVTLANGNSVDLEADYNDVQYMWTVEGSGGSALRACAPVGGGSLSSNTPACTSTTLAPDHWLIEDMEARLQAGYTAEQDIVQFTGSGSESSATQYPQHIHFRKDWFHGDWGNAATGANAVNNAFALTGSYISVVDSQCSEILEPGNDDHCGLAQGPGPYKFSHNWLEGGSSGCVAAGGFASAPSIFGIIPFVDVEFRRNRCTWPYIWLGTLIIPSTNSHWSGQSFERKNSVEIKTGVRILYSGNIFENVDKSGGQQGPLGDWNIRNASVGTGNYYQAEISDVTFSSNIMRNACEGWEMDRSSGAGSGGGVSYGFYRGLFRNNLFYNVSTSGPGCSGTASVGLQLSNGAGQHWQGTVTENGAGTAATFVANCSVDAGGCPGQIASLAVGTEGTNCSGNASLNISAPNLSGGVQATGTYTCSGLELTGVTLTNPGSGYTSPPTVTLQGSATGTVTVTMVTSPVTPPKGYQVLDVNAGDPVAVTLCPTAALNNVPVASINGKVRPTHVAPLASVGSLPWTGTPSSGNLTVSYPWTAMGGLSDTSGYCTITNVQGGPSEFLFQHNTFVTDATQTVTSNNGPSSGGNFAVNGEFRDSIMLGAGWNSGPAVGGEGNPSEKFNWDITSLTADRMVWPARSSSLYTPYGNNPAFLTPFPAMYFPATSYCSGSSPTVNCVGFSGVMSASSMPLTLSDYHGFSLTSGSVFQAGGSNQASDGTDIGPNIGVIDSSQTQTQYVCPYVCGTPGPFPD